MKCVGCLNHNIHQHDTSQSPTALFVNPIIYHAWASLQPIAAEAGAESHYIYDLDIL
jgi:hypothetical protein